MEDQDDRVGFLIVFVILLILIYGIHSYLKEKKKKRDEETTTENGANQDDDIWNISSRVNQQGSSANWPTHDHHISVDDFVLAPEYTAKDNRPPPPPYSEVDLPSYEQATGCRAPQADLPAVHIADRSVAGPSR